MHENLTPRSPEAFVRRARASIQATKDLQPAVRHALAVAVGEGGAHSISNAFGGSADALEALTELCLRQQREIDRLTARLQTVTLALNAM